MVDREQPAGLQVAGQRGNRLFGIRRVLDDSEADDDIERPWRDGKVSDVRLANEVTATAPAVCVVRLDGGRQVGGNDASARVEKNFREAPCAATRLEHGLPANHLEVAAEASGQTIAGNRGAAVGVQLRASKALPLPPERRGVVFRRHESRNPADDGHPTAARTRESRGVLDLLAVRKTAFEGQRFSMNQAAQLRRDSHGSGLPNGKRLPRCAAQVHRERRLGRRRRPESR